jgi:hypothetical protein
MEIPKLNNQSHTLREALRFADHVYHSLKKLPEEERPEFIPHFILTTPTEHFLKMLPKGSLPPQQAFIVTNLSDCPQYGPGTEYLIAKDILEVLKPQEVAIITDHILRNTQNTERKRKICINYQTKTHITLIIIDKDTEQIEVLIDNELITKTFQYDKLNMFPFILLDMPKATPNNIN